eukprot:Mycagemm_TRINITY_DN10190_c0_g1::TRINITY_DN10190_c0_g1_i2::g.5048::m.5048 type:complete len:174 gc:universal TRINITY_DN10190_c0_g1_i2:619-98(-)
MSKLGVRSGYTYVVNLRAGTARTSVGHLPEVLTLEGKDTARRQEAQPDLLGILIRRHALLLITAKVGRIDALGVETVDLSQELPRPGNALLLEVVTEGPGSKHLKERVVVSILADVVEIVVLAARTDALLAVYNSLQLGEVALGVNSSKENGLELIHASVCKQERGIIVWHDW